MAWLRALFGLCKTDFPETGANVTLGVDTPLGFSDVLVQLITRRMIAEVIGDDSGTNPYLFRATEQLLFAHGIKPLSPVKDMVGSQATKGMHVLAKFASRIVSCGVWSDGAKLTVIEAYPSPCRHSARIAELLRPYTKLDHPDKHDALVCALLGCLFATERDSLAQPAAEVSTSEGWIWVPQDVLP